MKVAIAGYGLEGRSSFKYFEGQGHEVTILDQKADAVVPAEASYVLGEQAFDNLNRFDLIVRSSGLNPAKLLDNNPDVKEKITTQLNEFARVCPSKNIIGITGTKGKGTTSTLTQKMLEACGKQVVIGGNIGIPMLDLLDKITPDTFVVLELSSFQLSDFKEKSPSVAICLIVDPEHLDWHGSLSSYLAAKTNLFSHQSQTDTAIYYSANELSQQIANSSPGSKIPYYKAPGAYVENNQVMIDNQVICQTSEIALIGEHNWQNICASLTAVWLTSQDVKAIRSVLTSFSGLEHRIEFVREVDKIRYYNDSFASQPKATEAAAKAIVGPKVMIIGGFDRRLDLDSFSTFIKNNESEFRKLLLIGASAKRLASSLESVEFKNYILSDGFQTMTDIVNQAKSLAQPGDSVILSPGFASFDMFKNFEDRGLQFKAVVNNL